MDSYYDINGFGKFPKAELAYRIDRKQFFKYMRKELNLLATNANRMKISELGLLEEEDLSSLIPKISIGTKISFQDNCVWGIPPDSTQKIKLFIADQPSVQVFNKINGHKSIGQIARESQPFFGMDQSQSYLFVRGLFLTLVQEKICFPINMPKPKEKTDNVQ